MDKLEKKQINTGKGDIYYFTSGISKRSLPVVFLHGLSSNHTTWVEIIRELEKDEIFSLAVDMRGHGFSDKTRKRKWYRIDQFTEDLEEIVKKENLSEFILLGYSFSGAVVLDYVKKYPEKVRGMILISANHESPLKYKYLHFLSPVMYALINLFGWMLIWQKRKKYYYFEQGKSKGYWDSTLKGFATMPLSINYWMLSEMSRISYGKTLEKICCPVLIIRSVKDPFFSEKEMREMSSKIPRCEAVILSETNHYLATAHQDKIKSLIINFVKKCNENRHI